MKTAELNTAIDRLARRIADQPVDDYETEIAELVRAHGDWVREAITDALTRNCRDTYSQRNQDRSLVSGHPKQIGHNKRLDIVLLSSMPEYVELTDEDMVRFLSDLVPGDFYAIYREVRMTKLERWVWDLFVLGYELSQMPTLLEPKRRVKDGTAVYYTERELRKALTSAQRKVYTHPELGWRTAMLEDIMRGKRPTTISMSDVNRYYSD